MVDQNASPNQQATGTKPESTKPAATGLRAPEVVQAGEMMLIFSLLLVFAVCLCVAIHLYLKRQKRKRRKEWKERKAAREAKAAEVVVEEEKTFAELTGTPLCEMGESEPRHEMEDAEVDERYMAVDLEHPNDHPVYSPTGTDLEAGTVYFGEMTTHSWAQPEAGMHAAYYARF